MHDLLIRGGTIVDGTGSRRFPEMSPFVMDVSQRSAKTWAVLRVRSMLMACWSRQPGSMCIPTMTPKWRGTNSSPRLSGMALPQS